MRKSERAECRHEQVEYLGHDHDARFGRCERCGTVFVIQEDVALAIPAVTSRAESDGESAPQ